MSKDKDFIDEHDCCCHDEDCGCGHDHEHDDCDCEDTMIITLDDGTELILISTSSMKMVSMLN